MKKPLSPDAEYVIGHLFPELEASFRSWSQEYQQERDLGALGEFVGLYRKARKLKTVFIDKVDPSNWRESVRVIALEVAAHALLLVRDIDKMRAGFPHEPGPLCDSMCGHDQPMMFTSSTMPRGIELGTRVFVKDLDRFEERVPGGWRPVCPINCNHNSGAAQCVRGLIGKPPA